MIDSSIIENLTLGEARLYTLLVAVAVAGGGPENVVGVAGDVDGAVGIHLDGHRVAGAAKGEILAAAFHIEHIPGAGGLEEIVAVVARFGYGNGAPGGGEHHDTAGGLLHQAIAQNGGIVHGVGLLHHGAVHIAHDHRDTMVKDAGDHRHGGGAVGIAQIAFRGVGHLGGPKPIVEKAGERMDLHHNLQLGNPVYFCNWVKRMAKVRKTGLKVLEK